MPARLQAFAVDVIRSLSGENEGDSHGDDGHSKFGVHITYEDLYRTVVFLVAIYVSGEISKRLLSMPSLVGEIFCGILLGPPLIEDFIPNPEAWVMFGEFGLVLLVIEAGIDIDLSTLKVIGTRGFLIAFIGSIAPIGLGMLIAWALNITDTSGIIAAGAVFGPTSLGIALNILRGGGILNTPVGQLIIAAAVIDDMIALVVLSLLETLVGEITAANILIPIVSALLFLMLGGYIAIFILPPLIDKYILVHFKEENHARVEVTIMFCLVLGLMPATYYAKASYLMGCFVAGLTFCSSHGLHHLFVHQFKRLLQWLMRIFFAASIGFQVPIRDFGDAQVIWRGLVFTLALIGKIGVGFLVPNFSQERRFKGNHLRDCLITGFSMAAEGEFAFVIAVFAVDAELISPKLYASVVLAVLLSTIIPPFLLRFTIAYYNKKGQEAVERVAEEEGMRKHILGPDLEASLVQGIKNESTVFLCIQTQSESSWGLLNRLMQNMAKMGLEVIDHRAWSPRGINTTLVNEVYARANLIIDEKTDAEEALNDLLVKVREGLEETINQRETAKVKVQRWFPGVVEEIVEEVSEKRARNITQRLLNEASTILERKQHIQTTATTGKTMKDLMGDSESGAKKEDQAAAPEAPQEDKKTATVAFDVPSGLPAPPPGGHKPRRRVRQKMRSTPVVGGGLFGEHIEAKSGREGSTRIGQFSDKAKTGGVDFGSLTGPRKGVAAELTVGGENYHIRISSNTLKDLQKGFSGQMVDSRGIEISAVNISATNEDTPVVQRLQGFVRNMPLQQIKEETVDDSDNASQNSSLHGMKDM